jgi:hypothetical protein
MKQRTNGRAVQGAARESNGARKGLRVGRLLAACTLQTESERYEYDKARLILFRINTARERRGARACESGRGGGSIIRTVILNNRGVFSFPCRLPAERAGRRSRRHARRAGRRLSTPSKLKARA